MLRKLPRQGAEAFPSSSRARRRRTSSPLQGPPGTRPVRGLRTLRILRISVSAGIRGRKVQARTASVECEGMEPAGSHSAVQGVRRLMQHSCGSARCQRSCVGTRPPHHLRPRSSKVRLRRGSTWSLFLQASAGKNPARSLPGAQEAAVPAAGAENAGHRPQDAAVKTASLACTHPTLPVIHCAGGPASAMLPLCFYSKVSACSRRSLYPASTSSRAHSFEPSRPRRRRPSAFRTSCRSLSASGSLRSPSRCPAKARRYSTPSRPPPSPRSTSFRALWHWQTHRRPTRPPPQPKPL